MPVCSRVWTLDLPNVSDIKGLTKGPVLDKLNKSLAEARAKTVCAALKPKGMKFALHA